MSIKAPASNDTGLNQSSLGTPIAHTPINATEPGKLHVIRRNGKITPFDVDKIAIAMTKAFLAVEGGHAAASVRIHETVERLTQMISATFKRRLPAGGMVHIEDIQDQVELTLMREGLQKVAREYVLYREERKRLRLASRQAQQNLEIKVTLPHGERIPLSTLQLEKLITDACRDLAEIDPTLILTETHRNLFDGVALADVNKAAIMSARTLIEKEPNYSYACARLLLIDLYQEALRFLGLPKQQVHFSEMPNLYANTLSDYIERGISLELLDPQLRSFDLPRLSQALRAERDFQFTYLGLQTLYDRYFIHHKDVRFEMPQIFFMRVAMGLALAEPDKNSRAIEFYNLLSSFDYMSSTPTL
ncbi:MAG TPA: ATP cone domain-containing protein, partial [Gammaproteobacteria bacterium]|nr:ATP cone domain-containing protein [Gammaproteobacteria bacterium]